MRNYKKPEEVNSPKNHISNVRVIYDGGAKNLKDTFSVAKVEWDGEDKIAVRWNVGRDEWDINEKIKKVCSGMPKSRQYPVWFILPDELVNRNSKIWKKIEKYLNAN